MQAAFNPWRDVPGEFDAGHLFGDEYGGPAEPLFYTHQRRSVNQSPGAVYNLELRITDYLGLTRPQHVEYSLLMEYSHRATRCGWRPFGIERVPIRYRMGYRIPGQHQSDSTGRKMVYRCLKR
ncbi:hypothetical protein [Nocardia seriolae]|uniref:hypothetical protein n=1 Tax=Nocardia seriolae TaxID=37332 RepID=UPI003F4DF1F3